MAFKLPLLQARMAIVDALGVPLTSFTRWWNVDVVGTIEAQERRQDATDAALQAQIDRLNAILAGTGEPFTGINVGGQDVKPFLDKTDGDKLVDDTGLDTNVVVTRTLNDGAANQVIIAYSGSVSVPAGVPTVVQTLIVTTVAGEVVDLSAQFGHLELSDPSSRPTYNGQWKRNGISLVPAASQEGLDITRSADPNRYVLAKGPFTVVATDVPGAGTHTYDVVVTSTVTASAVNPYARLLTATRP